VCSRCFEEKPNTSDFFGAKSPSQIKDGTKNLLHGVCKACKSKRSVAWTKANRGKVNAYHAAVRANKKAYIDSLKSKPCMDCRQTFPPYVMDYDHLPQFEKLFEISEAWARKLSLKKILEEIKKCELVCHNCHRIREYNRRNDTIKALREKVAAKSLVSDEE